MNKLKKTQRKTMILFSNQRMAVIMLVLFGLSMIPVIYCSFFDYATGDDLLYGSIIKQAIRDNLSFFQTAKGVAASIVSEYYTFQGAWTVGVLNRLQPGIWGEKFYIITPWIAIASLCGGSGYILYVITVRITKLSKSVFWILFSLVNFIMIQYMPYPRGGIFWYTGMINYTFSFGLALVTITWALRYVETGFNRFMIGMVLSMVYLGGAGLPTIVLVAFVFFILSCKGFLVRTRDIKKRYLVLFLPLIFEMISFIPNAIAPGNKVRGGEEFGFSFTKIVLTLFKSVVSSGTNIIDYFKTIPILYIAIAFILVVLFESTSDKTYCEFKHPIMFSLFLFIASCTVYAPEMYAGDSVAAGISGGVYDTYLFTFVVCLAIWLIYIVEWLKKMYKEPNDNNTSVDCDKLYNMKIIVFMVSIFCMLIFHGQMFGNSLDKTCIQFITSGQLADFDDQMQERLKILENPEIVDVVLPEMNDQQGPFMHMALVRKPDAYTNYVTAKFYGKKSVKAIPREEYNKLYK